MSNKNVLQLKDVTFNFPGEETLFEDLKLNISEGDVIGLVGINGAGKSTLLNIIMKNIPLVRGTLELNCTPYYVPQIDLTIQQGEQAIYEYIEQGYENWWEIDSEAQKLFSLKLNTDAQVKTLSGGELMKLNLTIALKNNPDFLILDEPTNHLDVSSIANLIDFIKTSSQNKYTFLLVSHDTFFLDKVVNKIINLEGKQLTAYGGNYTFYEEQKELHLRGKRKQHALVQEKLERANAQAQKEYEKQQRKIAKTKKDAIEGKEQDKYILGMKKDSGAATAKAQKVTFARIQNELNEALEDFETEEDRKLAFMHLKNTEKPADRTIFSMEGVDLLIKGIPLIKDIEWQVNYGDRIVIAGNNGTGKTSLIKALLAEEDGPYFDGEVNVNKNLKWVYIDQHYSAIKPELNLVENLMNYNPAYTENMAKSQLGKFKFKTVNEMNKLGSDLSGGEMVRLVMAMITAFPIDMIILDEPTNNLDVETVDLLTKALNKFRGAVIVISHNIDFLNEIEVKDAYIIKNESLKKMIVDPSHKDAYYQALLS